MSKVWKISEAASLAFHAMARLAGQGDRMLQTHEIAEELKVSEAHLSKVLQRLSKAGMVKAVRGPKGGFSLARRSEEIKLIEIYEVIEGKLSSVDCLFHVPVCDGKACVMGDLVKKVNREIRDYFNNTRLSEIGNGRKIGESSP